MKSFSVFPILIFLMFTGASYAQNNTPTTDPTQHPADTDGDKKTDFNYPQSPVRIPNSPSEDTLIKASRSGAIIHDTLVPLLDRKVDNDKGKRRGRKKDGSQIDTASVRPKQISVPR